VRDQLRNWSDCDVDAILVAEGCIRHTDMRGVYGIAGVASPGHACKGTTREPRIAPCFSANWAPGGAHPKDTRSPGGEGCPREKRMTLIERSHLLPRETVGAGMGRREVLQVHSTVEGGEPQGSREGRPRYPLEGRDEQVDVSAKDRMHGTWNPRRHVKWN
jgi:hypothetical protein